MKCTKHKKNLKKLKKERKKKKGMVEKSKHILFF